MRVPRAMLLGTVLLGLGSPMSSRAFARVTWSEIGSIQILEGPERIWVFVEVVRITDYTDEVLMHLMSRHPDEEIVSQTVFTIDRLGNVTEKAITGGKGPTLHPNLCRIFRLADGFYLYRFASAGRPASLYRWHEGRFSPMDEHDADEIRKKLFRPGQAHRDAEVIDELDAISGREGWKCVAEVRSRSTRTRPHSYRPGTASRSSSGWVMGRLSRVRAVRAEPPVPGRLSHYSGPRPSTRSWRS